jgi:hypothetical protein
MVTLKSIVLDVLKPHQPDALAFSRALAELGEGYRVCLDVEEVDEQTDTLRVQISGDAIELAPIEEKIASLGASIHSIDQVVVLNEGSEG